MQEFVQDGGGNGQARPCHSVREYEGLLLLSPLKLNKLRAREGAAGGVHAPTAVSKLEQKKNICSFSSK